MATGSQRRQLFRAQMGFCGQYSVLRARALISWWRQNDERYLFFVAIAIGAVTLAVQDWVAGTPTWDAMSYVNTHTCLGLLTTIYCLGTLAKDQAVFWRERNRGLSVLGFFVANAGLNTIDMIMQTFLFCSIYYEIRRIHIPFFVYVFPSIMLVWVSSGWGHAVATWVPKAHAPFVASLVIFVVCGLLGNPLSLSKYLANPYLEIPISLISITRWSIPMAFLKQIELTEPVYPKDNMHSVEIDYFTDALSKGSYSQRYGYWVTGAIALGLYGLVLRFVALAGLYLRYRDKQI